MLRASVAALAAGAALALLASSAEPRMHHPARGHRIMPGGAPLDGFTQPAAAYSLRKLRSAYAGSAVRIRRASDNLEADIGFLGFVPGLGAPWDVAAATAHCASTSCFLTSWYDQSGNTRDVVNATTATQPQLNFACDGSLACPRFHSSSATLASVANLTPATGVMTLAVVAKRSVVATVNCTWVRANGTQNRLVTVTSAPTWNLTGGVSGLVGGTASENAFHAAVAVLNGASSVVNVDGTETTGTATGSTTAGTIQIFGAGSSAMCDEPELIIWDNYALSAAERAALVANMKSFYSTP